MARRVRFSLGDDSSTSNEDFSEDSLLSDSDDLSDISDEVEEKIPLDLSTLNRGKHTAASLYREGPAPITDAAKSNDKNTISTFKQFAILKPETSDKAFELFTQKIAHEMPKGGIERISKSACDALVSYFAALDNAGERAKVDFAYIMNSITGTEGGRKNLIFELIIVSRKGCKTDGKYFLKR